MPNLIQIRYFCPCATLRSSLKYLKHCTNKPSEPDSICITPFTTGLGYTFKLFDDEAALVTCFTSLYTKLPLLSFSFKRYQAVAT